MTLAYQGRREDVRLVTGRGRYIADRTLPGQAFGAFLRADRPHAEILAIDPSAALAMPGVVAVFTRDNLEGLHARPVNPAKGKDGSSVALPDRPMLAADRVRFVGELVALVVAESDDLARDAAEAIRVDYRDLPAVTDAGAAAAPGAPQLHEAAPGNLNFLYDYGDEAAANAAFAKAAWTASVTVDAQRMAGNPMEPKSCLAAYDAATQTYELHAPNQGMSMMLGSLASVLGVKTDKIRLMPGDVGGAFGVRIEAYPEYLVCLFAAKQVGRPVKWVGTRAETMVSDHHGRAALLHGQMAMDAEGRFTAIRIEWLANSGAYNSGAGVLINATTAAGQAVGVYRIPAVYGLHTLVFTNTTPTTAYRGAGRPNCTYLIERLVDEAARVSGVDRIEIRRRNMIAKAQFPYTTPTGSTYDSGDPPGLLQEALDRSDWAGFEARRREAAARGALRGIGCGVIISPSGGAGVQEEGVIEFQPDGRARLYVLAGPSGHGHETVFPQLVAERLGMDPMDIELRFSDPDGPPLTGGGTGGSRSMMSHGGVLHMAAGEVIAKGAALVARKAGVDEDKVRFEGGLYRAEGSNVAISLRELARETAVDGPHPLTVKTALASAQSWPSSAHVAEVEIDPQTGELQVVNYVGVDDCGNVISPVMVEGQLQGGFMQGLGQVIGEHCIYDDETGQFLTGSFMDYFMPHARDLPQTLAFYDRPVPSPTNPLGAKGAGEAGTTGAIPTMANAVLDALAPAGVQALDMPYTAHRIWTALQAARAADAA